MGLLVPRERRSDPEWMDRPDNRADDLAPCLRDLRAINRLLGGRSALRRALLPRLTAARPGSTITVLDVGTGDADLPRAIVADARRVDRRVEIVAVDRDPVVLDLARATCREFPEIRFLRADARALPFPDASFDVVAASLFLHHFDDARAVEVLRALARVARGAVVVNDLRRHRLPWAFVRLLGRLGWISPMSAHDGPLSVLKGFTADELRSLAHEAGAARPRVRRLWPYRLLLEWSPA